MMLQVIDCITVQHDLRYVAAAAVICLFACFSAVSLLDRTRLAGGRTRLMWLTAAAAVAGSGIWATHFVAMLAFRPGFPVTYEPGLTLVSIAIAIAVSGAGFGVALQGGRNALLGGAVAGLGVAGMHFVGMAAVQAPAVLRWDAGYVVAAVLIGVVLSALALRVAVAPDATAMRRLQAATLCQLGIVGLHFTAMTAARFTFDPTVPISATAIDPEWLAVAVVALTTLIVGLGFIGSVVDHHLARRAAEGSARLRAHVVELEETKRELEETTQHLSRTLEAAAAGSQAKSQFLASMSHELRTPLNAVIGFSSLLSAMLSGPGNEKLLDYAVSIHDSGTHLLALINDVLDLSKLESGSFELAEEEMDLYEAVRDALRMVEDQAEAARVVLTETLPSGLPAVRADLRRFRQVLLNLLTNAVKFTPAGGAVRVTGRSGEDGISVSVTDTGIGIAPEDIPKAFERFGQIDDALGRRYEGTGLGLPLARSLMEMHGGTLELKSTVGLGTTVTVTLPASRILGARRVA